MNNKILKTGILASLLITTLACSQKKDAVATQNTDAKTVQQDSATVAAEKKKAAEAEKAKLPKPYHPEEDAEAKIAELVKQAKAENKNIILQAGGNWCIWCLRFNNYVQTTPELKELVDNNYLYYHLNFSPENKNEKVFAKYGDPGKKYGYPVFIILDKNGKQIHTQDSAVLEEGKGYSLQKVKDFFLKWVTKA